MCSYSILFLAGEASGDYHAAALLADLKERMPGVRACGIGGDKLEEAGMELFHHYREINTIALSEGLGKVRNIISAYRTMKRELRNGRHDLFVPVDFPDVNIRLCGLARAAGVPVCYYISPQVWAWRRGRVPKIARRVDRMMTIFPFEETIYRKAGVNADFVGHTMLGDIPEHVDKESLRRELGMDESRHTVALVPGSRPAEISRMLPAMCEAALIYLRACPDTRFVLPLAGEHLAELVDEILADYRIPVKVYSTESHRVMSAADSGLVTSGTATLQAALTGMPHAVVYKVDLFTWWFGLKVLKPLVMDEDVHLAIANVLSIEAEEQGGPIKEMADAGFTIPCQECGRPLLVPEVLQHEATPENLAGWLLRFRREEPLRQAMIRGFSQVRHMLIPREEGLTAATVVQDMLEKQT